MSSKRIIKAGSLSLALAMTALAASQTIVFDAIPDQIFGISPFPIAARSSSGLPVTFKSTTPAVCKTAGDLVILLSAGPCFITANQVGNGTYSAASAIRSFSVNAAKPSATLTASSNNLSSFGSGSLLVATGDFNGDGIPDLVEASTGVGKLNILLGNRSGGFTAGTPITVTSPGAVAVGDFNGDGFEDLAVFNESTAPGAFVTVLVGNGSGEFTPAAGSPVSLPGFLSGSLVVGDFNQDGILDLASANSSNNSVTVLLGNGAGGFSVQSPIALPAGTEPHTLAVGDFNGDGIQDLVTANSGANSVSVLLGNGAGGFTLSGGPVAVGSEPVAVTVGDFNGDGNQDLAVANHGSDSVTVLLGNGAGGFTEASGSPFATGARTSSVAVADFDGDGHQDLAVGSLNQITILLGNVSGGFTPEAGSPFSVGNGIQVPVIGDFNEDGIEDLIVVTVDDGTFTVMYGEASTAGSASNSAAAQVEQASASALNITQRLSMTTSSQTITFSMPGPVVLNGNTVTLTATASSNLAVTYASTTTSVCTVSGSVLTLVSVGPCTINANQSGGSGFSAAAQVSQTFAVVAPATFYGLTTAGQITTIAGNGTGGNGTAAISAATAATDVAVDALGNYYFSELARNDVRRVDAVTGIITTVAGNGTAAFNGDDGPAVSAELDQPAGIAVDSAGNLYIADIADVGDGMHGLIRKVSATSGIIVTVAGSLTGVSDGSGLATGTALSAPQGIAVDSAGNLYIADTGAIRKVTASTGMITTVAGTPGQAGEAGDGGLATAALITPLNLVLDASGNIFIVEASRIRRVDHATNIITTVAGGGSSTASGVPAVGASLGAVGIALDSAGNLYITDQQNHRIAKVDTHGIITTIAGTGQQGYTGDGGQATAAKLMTLGGIALDSMGNIYFEDAGKIRFILAATITKAAQTITFNSLANQMFSVIPFGVTASSSSLLPVTFYSTTPGVCTVSSSTVTLVDGGVCSITASQTGNSLYFPASVTQSFAVTLVGSLSTSLSVPSWGLTTGGYINTLAGDGIAGYSGDSGPADQAMLNQPLAVAVDSSGNVYISDTVNNRIREVTASNGLIMTVASGLAGPSGIAVDSSGNVYFAEPGSNWVRKVAIGGSISIIAGTGATGYSGDNGAASSAKLNSPSGVALDSSGNLYIADSGNNVIRKITASSGVITTIAGSGPTHGGYSGDHGAATSAQLNFPNGVAVDSSGNVYIADTQNSAVRQVSGGVITTIAGIGTQGFFSGDGGLAVNAVLGQPISVAVDSSGNAYIADNQNDRILEVYKTTGIINAIAGNGGTIPDPLGDDGPAILAPLLNPTGIALDSSGNQNLYIADHGANRVRFVRAVGQIASQTLTFSSIADRSVNSGSFQVTATTTASGLSVAFFSASSNVCSVTGNTVTLLAYGICSITASQAGNAQYSSAGPIYQSFSVTGISQTISFAVASPQVRGTILQLGATATSGLPVTYTSTTTAACTVSGTTVTILAGGSGSSCSITANQSGNSTYTAASPVVQSISITAPGSTSQTITFPAPSTHAYSNTNNASNTFTPTATATSGLTVTLTAMNSANICSATGTTVTILGAGTCSLVATQPGNATYAAATSVPQTFTVTGQSQTINVSTLTAQYLGAIVPVSISATSGLPVTISTTPSVCSYVTGPSNFIVYTFAAGTCTITVTQSGNSFWAAAAPTVTPSFAVNVTLSTAPQWGTTATGQISTLAGYASNSYSYPTVPTEGAGLDSAAGGTTPAMTANVVAPGRMAVDATGNVYFADSVAVLKIAASSGIISDFAGNPTRTGGNSGDNGTAVNASLGVVQGIRFDGSGNLFISAGNSVRKVAASGGVITTVAGGGTGALGDGGAATSANVGPYGVAVDASGTLYIADAVHNSIRKVTGGIISTIAGTGTSGYSGDNGLAVSAQLNNPEDVAIDSAGNLYIADTGNNAIRKIDVNGMITTIAGNGTANYSGDGGLASAAQLSGPTGIAVDSSGHLYIADTGNNRVRVINAITNLISTVTGNGTAGYAGDPGSSATAAEINAPQGVAVDSLDNVYVGDTGNNRVRFVLLASTSLTPQTITFGALSSHGLGASFTLSAAASSALPVTFFSATPTVCTITSLTTLTVPLASPGGICEVTAAQAGNSTFAAAANVSQSFTVTQISQTITFTAPGTMTFPVSASLGATSSSGLQVSYSSSTPAVCSVSVSTVTSITVGTCTIVASQAGNGDYLAATPVPQSFAIVQGTQTITFTAPATVTLPASASLTATSSSGLAVSYSSSTPAVCSVSVSTVTSIAAGTCTIVASQAGNTNYSVATPVTQSFAIVLATQIITFTAPGAVTLPASVNLTATSSSGLAVSYVSSTPSVCTVSGSTVTGVASGTCTIVASQAGNTIYSAATPVTQSFTINPAASSGGGGTTGGGGGGTTGGGGGTPVTVLPTSVTVAPTVGGAPATQTVTLSYQTFSQGAPTFTSNFSTNQGQGWLSVSPASGTMTLASTSGLQFIYAVTVTIAGDPTGVPAGSSYTGTVNFTSAGAIVSVPVTMNVSAVPARYSVAPQSLSFNYQTGAAAPAVQGLSVFSVPSGGSFTATASSTGNWLIAGSGGTAPDSVAVSVNTSGLAAGTYTGSVAITSGTSVNISVPVTLTIVRASSPVLLASPAIEDLSAVQGGTVSSGQITVSNSGGGTLQFTASGDQAWLSVAASGSATPGSPASLPFAVDPSKLTAGVYTGHVTVSDVNSSAQSIVTVVLAVTKAGTPSIQLSKTGVTLTAVAGGSAPQTQTVTVTNSGSASLNWSPQVTTTSGGNWLVASSSASSLSISANPAGLAAGLYYGSVNIVSANAANSPQSVSVVFNVVAATTSPSVIVSTGGIILVGTAGSATPAQQSVTLYNASSSAIAYSASPFTQSGGSWLSATPATGTANAGTNSIQIAADMSHLSAGVQSGTMTLGFGDGSSSSIQVLALTLAGSAGNAHQGLLPMASVTACAAGKAAYLIPIFRAPSSGSSLQVSAAVTVQAQVVDDCGHAVTAAGGGSVQVTFSNGDSAINLNDTGSGIWEATWVPVNAASSVTLQVSASENGLTGNASLSSLSSETVSVLAAGANAAPQPTGIANAASAAQAVPGVVSPGSYIAIYGTGLAGSGSPSATTLPLSDTLNGAQLFLGGIPMPLLYAGAGQVNALVPEGIVPNATYPLTVVRGTVQSVPVPLTVTELQPGAYTVNTSGSGAGIVTNALTGALITATNPAHAGDYLVIYATGLGALVGASGQQEPGDGVAAPTTIVYNTTATVTATIGGVNAPVLFSGLTATLAALYQVNVQMPAGVTPGTAVPVVLTAADPATGATAVGNTVTIVTQ